jgi:MoxR-like ATPase
VQLPDYTEDRGVIRYSDNLFIICTANSAISGGKRYETTPLKDPAFLDRFTRYEIVGILENRESLNKFKSISNNKLLNEVLEKLFNALEAMNDKNKADKIPSSIDRSRAISTRKMLKAKDIKEISIDNLVINTTVENQLEKFSNEQKEKIYDALSIEGSLKEILSLSDGTLKDILTTSPANTDSDK